METEFVQHEPVGLGPHPNPGPFGEAAVRGGAEHQRELGPDAAGGGHGEERGQDLVVAVSAPPAVLGACGWLGYHSLEQFLQLVRHQPFHH